MAKKRTTKKVSKKRVEQGKGDMVITRELPVVTVTIGLKNAPFQYTNQHLEITVAQPIQHVNKKCFGEAFDFVWEQFQERIDTVFGAQEEILEERRSH